MTEPTHSQTGTVDMTLDRILVLGFKVIFSELWWSVIRWLRSLEIRQMEKRLKKEYETLGRLEGRAEHESLSAGEESEMALCRKQIDFLSSELDHLRTDLRNLRQSVIDRRRQKWNI